jgi:RNA polymerase sigma-70 factor (ECF subfamily)
MIDNITIECIRNDRKVQTKLHDSFYKKVYNSCFRILREKYEAEDAMMQER